MTKDGGQKLWPCRYAVLKRALTNDGQHRVPDRHGRRDPILLAKQLHFAKQLVGFLPSYHRAALAVLDEDFHLACEHEESAGGFIALLKQTLAALVAPNGGVLE